jgi:hypothetical protein
MPEHLAVWRFTPVADPGDGARQDRAIWKELRIVAATAGAATLEAGRHCDRVRGVSDASSRDHQQIRSGFADEKLYRADRTNLPVPSPAGTVVLEEML